MSLRRFTRLYLDLDSTGSTTEKVELLRDYFRSDTNGNPGSSSDDRDKAWTLALLTGNRPKRATSTAALKALAREMTETPKWLFDACSESVGDLSETIALLLPEPTPDHDSPSEPLHHTIEHRVLPLTTTTSDKKKQSIIREAWQRMDADERFVYLKLIRGGFRVGVQKKLVSRALAAVAGVDDKVMAQRLVATIAPTPEAFRAALSGEVSAERALTPLPFYLATPLEKDPKDLGDIDAWHAEWKYDGIRAQLVRRNGDSALWSRGEELITHQFPEIVSAARTLPRDAVIDGEVLVWSDDADAPRPFAELQTRLNRKAAPSPQLGLFETSRVILLAFDLLELDGADLRDRPQTERRGLLTELLADRESDRDAHDQALRLSPLIRADSWGELADIRQASRNRGVEGLMLKQSAAPYLVGRTRSSTGWFKWKIDPYTIDCVMVAAQPGSGRRASLYTDYTFAVRADESPLDPDDTPTQQEPRDHLVTFAKAYSGLTQDEIEQLDRWIRANTTSKNGPFRAVKPEQVFELAFEGVQASPRHKAGLAVRFPRISRWRTDKPAAEIDTLATLRAMIDQDPTVPIRLDPAHESTRS